MIWIPVQMTHEWNWSQRSYHMRFVFKYADVFYSTSSVTASVALPLLTSMETGDGKLCDAESRQEALRLNLDPAIALRRLPGKDCLPMDKAAYGLATAQVNAEPVELEAMQRQFGLHELAVENVLPGHQSPTVEEFKE